MATPFKESKNGFEIKSLVTGFPAFYKRRKQRIITSDVWSYLQYLININLQKDARKEASAYLEQSFEFFEAAKNPRIGSKPLLYYYSFLNLAKILLKFNKVDFSPKLKHGIGDPQGNLRTRLKLEGQSVLISNLKANHSELFPEIVKALGGTHPKKEIKIIDLLARIPGIHKSFTAISRKSPSFIPIEKIILKKNRDEIWADLFFKKTDQNLQDNLKKLKKNNNFKKLFHQVKSESDDEIQFESSIEIGSRRGVDNAINRITLKIKDVGLFSILTKDGYKYYFSTLNKCMPQLASMYAVMFYLGSITRYKPYDFDKILKGGYSWLVEEFLQTQPTQFLYILASNLAGVDVVKPFAVCD